MGQWLITYHSYNYVISLQYVNHIKQLFENNGFKCTTRINENADEDFLIMCNSKYFVPSGGGFSSIIKQMVILKGELLLKNKNNIYKY